MLSGDIVWPQHTTRGLFSQDVSENVQAFQTPMCQIVYLPMYYRNKNSGGELSHLTHSFVALMCLHV